MTKLMKSMDKIEDVELLTDIFGKFPTFHDAEVLSFGLYRNPTKLLNPYLLSCLYVFEMTSKTDLQNEYVLKNKSIVHFRFDKIFNLEAENFNHQNVLEGLTILYDSDETYFQVNFAAINGLSAKFGCRNIRVDSVVPYSEEFNE